MVVAVWWWRDVAAHYRVARTAQVPHRSPDLWGSQRPGGLAANKLSIGLWSAPEPSVVSLCLFFLQSSFFEPYLASALWEGLNSQNGYRSSPSTSTSPSARTCTTTSTSTRTQLQVLEHNYNLSWHSETASQFITSDTRTTTTTTASDTTYLQQLLLLAI